MKNFFTIINLLVVILIAYSVYTIVNKQKTKNTALPTITIKDTADTDKEGKVYQKKDISQYSTIVNRNLFSTKEELPPQTQTTPPPAPYIPPAPPVDLVKEEARVKAEYQLMGTILKKKDSTALIKTTKDQEELIYRVGDIIGGKATVEKIERNSVVLNIDGNKYTIIPLTDKELYAMIKSREEVKEKFDEEKLLSLNNIRTATANMPLLYNQINLQEYQEEGKPAGFVINQVDPYSVFAEAGFKRGDILKSVNNDNLTNFDEIKKVYEKNQNVKELIVIIKRQGKDYKIKYSIQ